MAQFGERIPEGVEIGAADPGRRGTRPREVARSTPVAPSAAGLRFHLALGAILAIAALPRVIDAARNPLIFDEIYAIHLARLGLDGLLATLARDVDQPLHFLVVWAWRAIGGEGDLWIKTPPLLFALATLVVVAHAGRAMFGAPAGLIAAALLALQPTHVLYSQQARFHAMEWLTLTAFVWLGWRWVRQPSRRDGAAIVLLAAAALYTDWFTVFVLGTVALWGALALRREPRRVLAWLGLFALAAALYSPQIATLAAQIRRDIAGERLLPPMAAAEVLDLLRKLSYNAAYLIAPIGALALLPLARRETRGPAAMLWLLGVVGVLLPWSLSQAGIHLFISRQMLFTMPLLSLLLAAALVSLRPGWARTLAVVMVTAFAARACALRMPLEETVELPRAVERLRAHGEAGGTIVSCETRALLFVQHYLPAADARLLVMPDEEPFHYSDGILIFRDSDFITPGAWRERAARDRWAGIRLEHAGRDGPQAAALLDRATGGPARRFGRVSVWEGGPGAAIGAP